ncbi:hypothetical protein [Nonomuraea sp. NPDC002799]
MTGIQPVEAMPQPVRAARIAMWVQVAFGIFGLYLLFNLYREVALRTADWSMLLYLVPDVVVVALIGVLAVRASSGRKWVRISALVVEGFVLIAYAYPLFEDFTASGLLRLALPVIVIAQLLRAASTAWFAR